MAVRIEEIPCTFVGDFKVGDNLVYNAELLCDLVRTNKLGRFNKPIVIQTGAMLEAALSEIIFRARHFNREGVPNIAEKHREEIAKKRIDKFNVIIDVMKKYKVLDACGKDAYEDLHKLRKYRNKIHIQDYIKLKGDKKQDEHQVFTHGVCKWSIGLNYNVLKFLSVELARPKHIHKYVEALKIPRV